MTLVGYARVSTATQTTAGQVDRLTAAGCERVFTDHASGTKASRPQWGACRRSLQRGNTLAITTLDQVGRSVEHLVDVVGDLDRSGIGVRVLEQDINTTEDGGLLLRLLAAIVAFEHAISVERINEGLASARAQGRIGGRTAVLTETQRALAQQLYDEQRLPIPEIAGIVGVSSATLYRRLDIRRRPRDGKNPDFG